jgi:hypothetical protein
LFGSSSMLVVNKNRKSLPAFYSNRDAKKEKSAIGHHGPISWLRSIKSRLEWLIAPLGFPARFPDSPGLNGYFIDSYWYFQGFSANSIAILTNSSRLPSRISAMSRLLWFIAPFGLPFGFPDSPFVNKYLAICFFLIITRKYFHNHLFIIN